MIHFNPNLKLPGASTKKMPQNTKDESPMNAKQQELYKACMDFETIMTKQMLTAMQGETPFFGKGFGGEYFEGMFQDELAKNISGQAMGLGDVLYRQLAKQLTPAGVNYQIKTGK